MSEDPSPPLAESGGCANCGKPLTGRFCSACGQEGRDPTRLSLSQLVHEWLGDVLTFDSRLFRTLAPLIRKPGFLTREYLAGRRARYVPPLRLFVFISLVMFVVAGLTGTTFSWKVTADGGVVAAGGRHVEASGADVADPETPANGEERGTDAAAGAPEILDDPDELNHRLLERAPQAMFLLVPVFAFFVWILQRRRSHFYLSHLIFALHLHCFWFLVVTVATLIDVPFAKAQPGKLLVLFTMAPYLFLALRNVYGGGWPGNVLRTVALGVAQMLSFLAVMFALFALTVVLA